MTCAGEPVTRLLQEFAAGDKSALDRLIPIVYPELRRLAGAQLRRERSGNTLEPTALVHEAYTRLVAQDQPDYRNRAHFLGVAAQLMRQVLVDSARRRNSAKRGAGQVNLSLDESLDCGSERPLLLFALDEALCALHRIDPRKAKITEMRFFGGLTPEEMATVLDLPIEQVLNEQRVARAWLSRRLGHRTPSQK